MGNAADVHRELEDLGDPEKAAFQQGFFRTGPGEYGEGDRFLGIVVPELRRVAKGYYDLPYGQLARLLRSPVHELRFVAVVILVERYRKGDAAERQRVHDFYLEHRDRVNNWDLVDVSARQVVGEHLVVRDRALLYELAESEVLWDRRIAIIASWAFTKRGEPADTLRLSELLLGDREDLMHKAVGWMLREVGKVDEPALLGFLDRFHERMPRTMLRYATERLHAPVRRRYIVLRGEAAG